MAHTDQSNFQDVVQLNIDTLSMLGNQIVIGTETGSKSVVLQQDPAGASALHLAASNPTGQRTQIFQDANGTIGLLTNVVAGAATITGGGVSFANSNGVSFGVNGNTVTASVAAGATVVSGIGVSTGGNTAGNTGTVNGTVVFAGVGGVTLSQSTAAGSSATISISMTQSTGPGAFAAGTQTATSGTVVFANSNGFTFGMSGSSQVTATYERRITAFSQWAEFATNWSISNGSMSIQKVSMPMHLSATRLDVLMALAGNTNSSGALSISMGIYTLQGGTASLATTASRQISWTSGSQTSASSLYGGASGTRYRSIAVGYSLTPGDYLFVFNMKTTNDGTWRQFGRDGVNIVGSYDADGQTDYWLDGTSNASFTTALPNSIAASDTGYARTGLGAMRQPGMVVIGSF